ncbi:non-ribosomal peptide synthetase [Rosistilla oblonga]|uniref:Polyketide synthase PksJ n=1 Tax=Rosistilla oblonga TaxID=2527990 RepID=A0A518IU36_9BACT|nr:non-ribosomal peptide synthetase [Rosistilla oblonga]QDV56592.1 Polyketide synthase PksJ [Rosistilla oblonga]
MDATENSIDHNSHHQGFTAPVATSAPKELPTLVHRLRWYGQTEHADRTAFTMVLDHDFNDTQLNYRDLDHRARAIAARIQALGGAGERVLIVLDPGMDYVSSLFGCMYAGAVAVPVYPPSMLRLQHTLGRLQAIIQNADAKVMLSSREIIGPQLSPLWNLDNAAAIAVDELSLSAADDWRPSAPAPDELALLQYTSGSTGIPRGVALTHANLMHNLRALVRHYHFPGAKALHWLPPYHDMGLIGGILLPAYEGVETVILTPKNFISNPLHWLQAIDRYQGTSNGSPNFGYELCVRKIKPEQCEGLDLSSWKVAVSGAEPVRAATAKRFTEKFQPYGFDPAAFSPAMGMAETTVIMTGSPLGKMPIMYEVDSRALAAGRIEQVDKPGPGTQTLVSSGEPVLGMEVEIVDPQTCRLAAPGQVAEIWARSGSIAAGYWNQPELTQATFHATIAGTGESGYLRTGDLGCIIDGQLIVTGRIKELIIIGGRNYYPHDIEATVQSISEAFKPDSGTAFSIDHDGQEQLVVLQEVWRPGKFAIDNLLPEALEAIAESHQVTPHAIVLVKSGSLPKTSSGKLRRRDCRQMFLDGELSEVRRWQAGGFAATQAAAEFEAPETETEVALASIWSELLHVDEISRHHDFFDLGGQSLLVGQLVTRIGEQFGVEIGLSTLFSHSTLGRLAAAIDAGEGRLKDEVTRRNSDAKVAPLSAAQQRFWLLHELEQTNAFLHVPVSLQITGDVDADRLEASLAAICQRHPALRTIIEMSGDVPMQRVLDHAPLRLQRLTASPENVAKVRSDLVRQPFDLQTAPLMRAALIETGPSQYQLEIVLHHIVCDASSVEVLLRDLIAATQVDPEQLTYLDFAQWDQSESHIAQIDQKVGYWQTRLAGIPERLQLPVAESDLAASDESPAITRALDGSLARDLESVARDHGTTASMVYLAAYQHVLSRYTGSSDLPIAMPTTDRPSSQLAATVGCFMNPIIFRGQIDRQASFLRLLRWTRDHLLHDLEHADVPFQRVVESIDHQRSLDAMPLAQNMFLFQQPLHASDAPIEIAGGTLQAVQPDYAAVTAYDLSMVIHPSSTTEITVVHNDHIDRATAEGVLDLMEATLQAIAANPACALIDLPSASPADRKAFEQLNLATAADCDSATLCQRLGDVAANAADKIAITDDHRGLSYSDLDAQSTALAKVLRQRGIAAGNLVGVDMQRSIEMLVGMLAVWKAGAAYVPLDPALPQERLAMMIEDAGLAAILSDTTSMQADVPVWQFAELSRLDAQDLSLDGPLPTDLAYVIYTSGSTGKPKGVAIEHHSVANLLNSFAARPGFTADDSILALTTTSFDISVLELFLPLWAGGHVRLTADRAATEPESLKSILETEPITHLQTTPSTLRVLLTTGWTPSQQLRVFSGGEPLPADLASQLLASGCELWNVYGPTETTVWSTISRVEGERVCIGQAIDNTTIHLLDPELRPVPRGVSGELCIGGSGVARGYWNRPELTRQRFVTLPTTSCSAADSLATDQPSPRVYRTGDQVRIDSRGELHFLARNDRQIKLRGFRIELDEIESAIESVTGVHRAAVVVRGEAAQQQIVAFCQTDVDVDAIRRSIGGRLPQYMLPSTICRLPAIPQTPAGKTDYKALPLPNTEPVAVEAIALPQTPLEHAVANLWQEVLQTGPIGRDVSFFELGGNSLQAAQLLSRLRDQFEAKIPLRLLYDSPTIAAIAESIVQDQLQQADIDEIRMLEELESLSDEEVQRRLGSLDASGDDDAGRDRNDNLSDSQ